MFGYWLLIIGYLKCMDISNLNYLLATATIGLQIVTVILLFVFLMRKKVPSFNDIAQSVGGWGLWIAFGITLVTFLFTEYYKILGFEPCPLCWWQEIFLYPQIILFGMAIARSLWKSDIHGSWISDFHKTVAENSIVLSIFGAGVALYQHILQMTPHGTLPCPATGTVSCATRILFEYNYITFPLMAFTTFAFLIVVMLLVRSRRV